MGIEDLTNSSTPTNMEDGAGRKAREKRDRYHFTQKGQEKDQLEFERARRSQDRAEGREPSLYSAGSINSRRINAKQLQFQADERNATRGKIEKVLSRLGLGPKGVTSMDVLKEEAERVNELVDKKVAHDGGETSPQEAADAILGSEEFRIVDPTDKEILLTEGRRDLSGRGRGPRRAYRLPGVERAREQIEFKEYLRSLDPELEKSIDAGNIAPASAAIRELAADDPRADIASLWKMVEDKVDTMARSNDIPAMERLLSENSLEDISFHSLTLIPPEILTRPEIKSKILDKLKTESGFSDEKKELLTLIGEKESF